MLRISDNFWNEIKNIFPVKNTTIGRPCHDKHLTLSGIFFILDSGCQWRNLPHYYGKPSTVHGWFTLWVKQGIFHKILEYSIAKAIEKLGNPECFIIDTSSSKSPFAKFGDVNPVDRKKHGIKKGIVIDWNRIIHSIIIDAANKHDSKMLLPHLPKLTIHTQEKPLIMLADSAFDAQELYTKCYENNIFLFAATNIRRDTKKKKIYPKGRWKIEQIFGIQQWLRGIKFCWSKLENNFLAMCQLASAIHNFKLIGIFG